MKIATDFSINGKTYPKAVSFLWYWIYPFFLVHMLAFGLFAIYAQINWILSLFDKHYGFI